MALPASLSLGPRPRVLADLLPGERARDLALVLGGAAFVGLLAQISFHLPGTPVPVTGQTLGVLVAGCALGLRRALAASVCYVVLGFAGLPWFAGHSAGWAGASSGYLFGFVLASALCGGLAERGSDRGVLSAVPTMLLAECVIFACGVGFLAVDLHVGLGQAVALGLTPFLAGEAVKLVAAGSLLPGAWRLAGRRGSGPAGARPQRPS